MISDTLSELLREIEEWPIRTPPCDTHQDEIEALKAMIYALQLFLDLAPGDADLAGLRSVLFGEWEVRELNPETKTMSSYHEAQLRIHKAIVKRDTLDKELEAMMIGYTIHDMLLDDDIYDREMKKEKALGSTRLLHAQIAFFERENDEDHVIQFLREYFPKNIKELDAEQLRRVAKVIITAE